MEEKIKKDYYSAYLVSWSYKKYGLTETHNLNIAFFDGKKTLLDFKLNSARLDGN